MIGAERDPGKIGTGKIGTGYEDSAAAVVVLWLAFGLAFLGATTLSGFYHWSGYTGAISGFLTGALILSWALACGLLVLAITATVLYLSLGAFASFLPAAIRQRAHIDEEVKVE